MDRNPEPDHDGSRSREQLRGHEPDPAGLFWSGQAREKSRELADLSGYLMV